MEYYIHLAILVGIYLILAQSLNLTFGLARIFNLAHMASYAIGAYVAAILTTRFDMGTYSVLCSAFLAGGLFSALTAGISLRLSQDYFAIGSLAFASIVSALLINWRSLTQGVLGISGIPRPVIFGHELIDNREFLLLTWSITIASLAILYLLFKNSYGRMLRAQGENELAGQSIGIESTLVRWISFAVSSAFAGVAGALFAYYINYIDPSSFGLSDMIFVLMIVIIGKPGSFWGVTLGAVFLVLLPEPLRFIDFSPGVLGPLRQLLYGMILFLLVAWNRERLFPPQREV